MSVTSFSDILNIVMNVFYVAFFAISFFFSQRIQTMRISRKVSKALTKLNHMKDRAKQELISAIPKDNLNEKNVNARLDRILQFFTIRPSSMDPAGVIERFEYLLDNTDTRVKDELKSIVPQADEKQLQNLQNLVEVAQALNKMYLVLRQYYLLGKKPGSQYPMIEIEMQLPNLMEEAEAYVAFTDAFKQGKPIGDGIGPLTASKLMVEHEKYEVAKETVASEIRLDGRRVIVMKANGPGGSVGKIGDALQNLLRANKGEISLVIMLDAALKLEGEDSGSIMEGTGAAIGGPGIGQFKIEEITTDYKVPVYAVVVKESVKEVLAPMTAAIVRATDEAVAVFRRVIQEKTKVNDSIIIVGVGNTMGIGQ